MRVVRFVTDWIGAMLPALLGMSLLLHVAWMEMWY